MSQLEPESFASDRRTQTRIQVQIPVEVTLPGLAEPVIALNQDLSWGGALLRISEPLPKIAGTIQVRLPWKRDERISADARLLRAIPQADGGYLIAVRFVSLSPRSQSRLERLLKMLRSGRETPAVGAEGLVRELEVVVHDVDEMRKILKQIAQGHHTVTVFDAYERNQSISLAIVGTHDLPGIRLRARVLDVQSCEAKDCDWAELHTLFLELEHPKQAIRSFVRLLLDQLPKTDESSGSSGDVPDWLRYAPMAKPTEADRVRRDAARGELCELEMRYPEALNRLIAGWGDVDAFEMMFRDLVIGDAGQPGGWPAAAWQELELAQGVHDLAYGMSPPRQSRLKGGRSV